MSFESIAKKIAHKAAGLSDEAMGKLASRRVAHEDDLTGVLLGALGEGLKGFQTEGVVWDTAILTHRRSGQEKRYGGDMLIHVKLDTLEQTYSKGVLVQAKRIAPDKNMTVKDHSDLQVQCGKMLKATPASFVFAYDPQGMRSASATKIAGSTELDLYDQCDWTAYRFFLELFRCPIGDPRITSADVSALDVDAGLKIAGEGTLTSRRRRPAATRG